MASMICLLAWNINNTGDKFFEYDDKVASQVIMGTILVALTFDVLFLVGIWRK